MSNEYAVAIMSHKVTDFDQWKKAFDLHESTRKKAGVNAKGIFRSFEESNQVTVILEAPSADVLVAFGKSSDLKTAMSSAGVIGVPEVQILRKVQD